MKTKNLLIKNYKNSSATKYLVTAPDQEMSIHDTIESAVNNALDRIRLSPESSHITEDGYFERAQRDLTVPVSISNNVDHPDIFEDLKI